MVLVCPWPIQFILHSGSPFSCVHFPTVGIISYRHQGTLDPIFQITFEDPKVLSLISHGTSLVTGCWFEKELLNLTLLLPASQFPTHHTSLDHNTPAFLGGGSRKPQWEPWRNPSRQCLPWGPHQPSRLLLCHRRWQSLSSTVCPWWIHAVFSQLCASSDLTASRWIHSTIFPRTEVRLMCLQFSGPFFKPFL